MDQINEYFSGNRTQFDLALIPSGTAFFQPVKLAFLSLNIEAEEDAAKF